MTAEVAPSALDQVRRFWRWWTGELRECIPASWVAFLTRLSVLPLVVPEGEGYTIHRYDGTTWRRVASVRAGETPEATAKALGAQLAALRASRFALALPAGQFLSKIIHLPDVAEDNLRTALGYELDRHTPFKPEDVGFDCCVVDRNDLTREIAVRLVIATKTTIAEAIARVAASGALVAAVQPAFPDRASLSLDLLPHEEAVHGPLERARRWAPWAVLAALAGVAIVLPVWQKRAQVIELQPQVMLAARDAQAADQLHQQLERAQGEYNFVLQKRYAAPTTLQLLNEVSRILPDDTWLQNFEIRSTLKGKELQLQGETGVAGKMIELFEQSPLFTNASFKSPVTQAPGSQASRFHLGMEVREGTPPALATAASSSSAVPATARDATATATTSTAPTANAPDAGSAGSSTAANPSAGGGSAQPTSASSSTSSNTPAAASATASRRTAAAPSSTAPSAPSSAAAPAAPAGSTASATGAAPTAPSGNATTPAPRPSPRPAPAPPVIQTAPETQPAARGKKSAAPVVAANEPAPSGESLPRRGATK